jgi:hypothetical protein
MKYLSVLTPPLLVCAVFLTALVAFLRHEMGSRRRGSGSQADEIAAEDPIPECAADSWSEETATAERKGNEWSGS